MEIIVKVEGMMCPHCEARVKSAVEAVPGVASATASHEDSEVRASVEIPEVKEKIIEAIEAAGYKVIR